MNDLTRAYNMDCVIGMAKTADKYYDLAVCDIPYGIGVGKMAYLQNGDNTVLQPNGTRLKTTKSNYALKDWDSEPPAQEYFDELCRISKHQIIFGIDYCRWEGVGTGRIKWDKCVAEGVSFKRYEVAYCSLFDHEETLPLMWAGMCQAKSLAEPTTQQGNKALNEKRIHPTQKPVFLYQLLFKKYANKGYKIIDTHMGSQSSRIAAFEMGFDYDGYEIDTDYFNDGCRRFKQHTSQLKLFAA